MGTIALMLCAACSAAPEQAASAQGTTAPTSEHIDFVRRIVGDTEDVWDGLFRSMGRYSYPKPKVLLFSKVATSACGTVIAAAEPVYCPRDRNIYLDLASLSQRMGFPDETEDFASAYLIVHEVSRHVQHVLGTAQRLERDGSALTPQERMRLQVILELQADCYTGVSASFVRRRDLMSSGDIVQGASVAHAAGYASTHGSAAEQLFWFKRGFVSGGPRQCEISRNTKLGLSGRGL